MSRQVAPDSNQAWDCATVYREKIDLFSTS
jgi:hypothetical protein